MGKWRIPENINGPLLQIWADNIEKREKLFEEDDPWGRNIEEDLD